MDDSSVRYRTAALGGVVVACVLCLTLFTGPTVSAPTNAACPAGNAPHGNASANASADASVDVEQFVAADDAFDELDDLTAIRTAMADGRVVPGAPDEDERIVTVNNTHVYRVQFDGAAAKPLHDIEASSERGVDRAVAALLSDGGSVELRIGVHPCFDAVNLAESLDAGAATSAVDARNGSIYVVLDQHDVITEHGVGMNRMGGTVEVTVRNGTTTYEDEVRYDVDDPEVEFDTANGLIRVNATANATVSGWTNRLPGTNLTVLVDVDGEPSVRHATATVGPDRRFRATYDLSSVPENASVTAAVDGLPDSWTVGLVGPHPGAAIAMRDQRLEEEYVTVDSFSLPDDGHIVLKTFDPVDPLGGRVLAHDYVRSRHTRMALQIRPAEVDTRQVVAVAVRDDGDHVYEPDVDRPYRRNGEPVTAVARIVNPGVEPTRTTPDTPTEPSPTPTPTKSTPDSQQGESVGASPTTTEETGPGLGAAVALLAVAVSALLGVRLTRR